MRSLRQTISTLSPAIILVSVLCEIISAQSGLTTIQDTLFDADGLREPAHKFTVNGNGKQVRDLLHVNDAIRCCLTAHQKLIGSPVRSSMVSSEDSGPASSPPGAGSFG